jgi:hypothetical protein
MGRAWFLDLLAPFSSGLLNRANLLVLAAMERTPGTSCPFSRAFSALGPGSATSPSEILLDLNYHRAGFRSEHSRPRPTCDPPVGCNGLSYYSGKRHPH